MKNFRRKLSYVKVNDIIHLFAFFIAIIPSIILKISYKLKKKPLWLLAESKYEARDNAFVFFKYLNENQPLQNVIFSLSNKSPDYEKVKNVGRTISYGTLKHWIYYLAAEVNISSQKSGKPNAAVCYFFEVYGLLKNKRVFLQHGIVLNDLEWLYYKNTKLSMFVCGSEPEFSFVKEKFGYPENLVKYLGLCRFDNLHNVEINKKQIVFMPSWRNWLVLPTKCNANLEDDTNFKSSEYFKKVNGLINDPILNEILEDNDINFIFYPHRDMHKFIKYFSTQSKKVKIMTTKDIDIQDLIKESALMITDYSSVSMDFAYMKKPVIYYQFDVEKFRKGHYEEGYFSYSKDGFGPVVTTTKGVIDEVKNFIDTNYEIRHEDYAKHMKTFPIYDAHNCERTYKAIKEL